MSSKSAPRVGVDAVVAPSKQDDDESRAVIFQPELVAFLFTNEETGQTFSRFGVFRIDEKDKTRVQLEFFEPHGDGDVKETYTLDLAARVTKVSEEMDVHGNVALFRFLYQRLGISIFWEVLPVSSSGAVEQLRALEFLLSQFCYAQTYSQDHGGGAEEARGGGGKGGEEEEKPNVVATSLEGLGGAFRSGLKSGGKATGHAIRFLGKKYTDTTVYFKKPEALVPREVTEKDLENAMKHKDNCELVHAGARTVTGSILYPVRWTGKQAVTYMAGSGTRESSSADKGEGTGEKTTKEKVKKAAYDTAAGLGNGLSSLFKGVTEFVGEVGEAIGDASLHHSKVVNGEEYAEKVTKLHVEGAGSVGLGFYKVGNVASLGLHGLAIEAMLEGTVMASILYEFLVGPVLLSGFFSMIQVPEGSAKRYFVVLRPWSLSFYKDAKDFCGKPEKIVPTALLDTLPLLRIRDEKTTESNNNNKAASKNTKKQEAPMSKASTYMDLELTSLPPELMIRETEDGDAPSSSSSVLDACGATESVCLPLIAAEASCSTSDIGSVGGGGIGASKPKSNENLSIAERMKGGRESHIELCTLDCSSYLLFPENDTMMQWFELLKQRASCVETVQKRKSGADEIAIDKRLQLLPRALVFDITVDSLEVKSESKSKSNTGKASNSSGNELEMIDIASPNREGGSEVIGEEMSTALVITGVYATSAPKKEEPSVQAQSSMYTSLTDPLRNSVLVAARVRMTPIACGDVKVRCEQLYSSFAKLEKGANGGLMANWTTEAVAEQKEASEGGDGGGSSSGGGGGEEGGSSAAASCNFSIGTKAHISEEEIEAFVISVRCKTLYREDAELGKAVFDLASLIEACEASSATGSREAVSFRVKVLASNKRVVGVLSLFVSLRDA